MNYRNAVLLATLGSIFVLGRETRAVDLLAENFGSGNGGFSVANTGGVTGPWTYNPAGFWATAGEGNAGSPSSSALISPTLTAPGAGPVSLTFSHRHSFEKDTTVWDGGQVRLSVNGGAFVTVPGASFSSGGYTDTVGGNNALTGQSAFSGDSAGYGAGTFTTSVANLGSLAAGNTFRVQFLGAWDEFATGTVPNWAIDSVTITAVPEPGTLALGVVTLAALRTFTRRRTRAR
jgi:hypothetical protein